MSFKVLLIFMRFAIGFGNSMEINGFFNLRTDLFY